MTYPPSMFLAKVCLAMELAVLPLAAAGPFAPGVEVLRFPAAIDEISGLAPSRANPGLYWVHNDSGGEPRAYAVNGKGVLVGSYLLSGAVNVDWEDMSIGPAPGGGNYLYFADIGDNRGIRESVRVYRVREPTVKTAQTLVKATLKDVTSYEFVYEDGPRDAESFFVDPITSDFYVVTKRELDGNRLYRAANPSPSGLKKLLRVGQFAFTGATGAAISPDGLQVIVRRYSSANNPFIPSSGAATYWRRASKATSIVELMRQPGTIIALVPEEQGEAIAFAADGRGLYSTGESGGGGERSPLTYYAPVK